METTKPQQSNKLAEFLGILSGDGFMNYYPKRQAYLIEIAGNKSKDYKFLKSYVSSLTNELFGFNPKFYSHKNQNTIRLVIRNKGIFEVLKQQGFPIGRKGELSIQPWILEKDILIKSFIKGFFDTDGYLCLKKKEGKLYPVIGLVSKSKTLLEQISKVLAKENISSYLGSHDSDMEDRYYKRYWKVYKLQISGKKNVLSFFNLIGSNNERNLLKYKEFLNI